MEYPPLGRRTQSRLTAFLAKVTIRRAPSPEISIPIVSSSQQASKNIGDLTCTSSTEFAAIAGRSKPLPGVRENYCAVSWRKCHPFFITGVN
jgi:hypothetical protein